MHNLTEVDQIFIFNLLYKYRWHIYIYDEDYSRNVRHLRFL